MQEDMLSHGTQNWQPSFGRTPTQFSPSMLAALFAIAVLLMVSLTSIEGAVLRAHRGEAIDWGSLVQGRLLAWGTCAAFVPPLYLLTTLIPIGRSAWWIAVPAHLVASVLATVGKYTLFVPMARTLNPDSTMVWVDTVKSGFFGELMFYWAMIGLAHAVFYFTREGKQHEPQTATGDQKRPVGSRIAVSVGARTELIILAELEWVAAQGNYILIYTCNRRLLVRHTLHGFASKLPGNFVQASRSAIVNLDRVERVEPLGEGKWRLHLLGGTSIPLGRTHKDQVLQLLRCAFVPA